MPEYHPLDPATLADPYPTYTRLRATTPIFWHERTESWMLTRYADCRYVLRRPELFASDWRRAGCAEDGPAPSMQELDPPDHTPLRRLFVNAVNRHDMSQLAQVATAHVTATLEGLADAPAFDFTADIARPVALHTICRLLGVPTPAAASFGGLADALVRGMDAGLNPAAEQPALAAKQRLNELIETWFAAPKSPGILCDVLGEAEHAGVSLPAVWSTVRVLLLAAFSTTVAAAANAVLALLHHRSPFPPRPDDAAVDELLRFDGAVQATARACVENVVIDGVKIERGQCVTLLIGSANRDPSRFADPDVLRLERRPNPHLGFGWGPHACTGAQLAKLVLRSILVSLADQPRPLRLAAPPERAAHATLRYPDRLPVTFAPDGGDA